MSPLNELLNQFIKVIVDYHNHQTKKNEDFNSLVQLENKVLKPKLDGIIKATIDSYAKREGFYKFLAQRICELKELVNRSTPLSRNESEEVKNKLKDLLMTCYSLLSKREEDVINSPDDFELKGFALGGYFNNTHCRTGQLIKNVLDEWKIPSPNDNGNELLIKISCFIEAHQKPLEDQLKIESIQEKYKKLEEEKNQLEMSCRKLQDENSILDNENRKLKNKISQISLSEPKHAYASGYIFPFFQQSRSNVTDALPENDPTDSYDSN